jgi:hypothetical protein
VYLCDKLKKGETSGECRKHENREMHTVESENPKRRDHLKDIDVDGLLLLLLLLIICDGGDRIELARVRALWRAFVDTIMNLQFRQKVRNVVIS